MRLDETYFKGADTDDNLTTLTLDNTYEYPAYPLWVGMCTLDFKKVSSDKSLLDKYFAIARKIHFILDSSKFVSSVTEPAIFNDTENFSKARKYKTEIKGIPYICDVELEGKKPRCCNFGCGFSIQNPNNILQLTHLITEIIVSVAKYENINSDNIIRFIVPEPYCMISAYNPRNIVEDVFEKGFLLKNVYNISWTITCSLNYGQKPEISFTDLVKIATKNDYSEYIRIFERPTRCGKFAGCFPVKNITHSKHLDYLLNSLDRTAPYLSTVIYPDAEVILNENVFSTDELKQLLPGNHNEFILAFDPFQNMKFIIYLFPLSGILIKNESEENDSVQIWKEECKYLTIIINKYESNIQKFEELAETLVELGITLEQVRAAKNAYLYETMNTEGYTARAFGWILSQMDQIVKYKHQS